MKTITLHYKDDNGVVRDTVRHVVPDKDVEWYVQCYGRNRDMVVVRVTDARPRDLRRDKRGLRRTKLAA